MKTKRMIATLSMLCLTAFCSSAYAFSDVHDSAANDKLTQLEQQGIISGIGKDQFAPNAQLTYAQGVVMLVNGLGLNIDNIRFIKKPEASDYFTHVPDNAWYAQDFIIASMNGLPLDRDLKPSNAMTREEFANDLLHAINQTGNYMYPQLALKYADADQVDSQDAEAVRTLLALNIATLDDKQQFRPKAPITRLEAGLMLYGAVSFVQTNKSASEPTTTGDDPFPQQDQVSYTTTPLNDKVSAVTLSWGEKPNPGYSLAINEIRFTSDHKAVIDYDRIYPIRGRFYIEMITHPQAVTYISSDYSVELHEVNTDGDPGAVTQGETGSGQ